MELSFKSRRLEKEFSEDRKMQKAHGARRAKLLKRRLQVLWVAKCLADFWPPYSGPERCHELTGNRRGQLSMDLDHPYRLIFCPEHEPVPLASDGSLSWSSVTAIRIVSVEDTHD